MRLPVLCISMFFLTQAFLFFLYTFPKDAKRTVYHLLASNAINIILLLSIRPLVKGRVRASMWIYSVYKTRLFFCFLFFLMTLVRTYAIEKKTELVIAVVSAIAARLVLKCMYYYTKNMLHGSLATGHNVEILKLEKYLMFTMSAMTRQEMNSTEMGLVSFYKNGPPKAVPAVEIFEKWSRREEEGDAVYNEYGYDLGESIRIPNRPRLTPETDSVVEGAVSVDSLTNMFSPQQANEIFDIISYGERTRIRYDTFCETFRQVFAERSSLYRSLKDYRTLLRSLSRLFLFVEGVFCFLVFTLVTGLRNFFIHSLLSFCLVYLVVPGTMSFCESFIFLVLAHPYDNGDRVLINGENMVVRKVGLFSTSFDTWAGQRVIMQNSVISKLPVVNIRRSLSQYWTITATVLLSCPSSAIANFKKRLKWYVEEEKMLTNVIFAPDEIVDNNKLVVKILVRKKSNFQSGFFTLTNFTKCLACIIRILIEEGLYYKPPILRTRPTDDFIDSLIQTAKGRGNVLRGPAAS